MRLVRRSVLSASASGKDLSDGWAVNFAIGCSHGCLFCYVDRIWRLHAANRRSPHFGAKLGEWGEYLYVPEDLAAGRIEEVNWILYWSIRYAETYAIMSVGGYSF